MAQATPAGNEWGAWARPWRATILLIVGVLIVRLVYLRWFCPYTLIEDEAHYWEWSRRLAMSYYTKGPGVAWTIALFTRLFGDTEFGVRFGAPVASAAGSLLVGTLARGVWNDGRIAFFAAACFMLAPLFQVLGLTMTIDGPYVACWAAAMCGAWCALGRGRWWGWPVFGVALGLGILYKYTILLCLPGVLAFVILRRRELPRGALAPGALLAGAALLVLGVSPIVLWNTQEGWPTVHHLLGHLGVAGGDMPVTQGKGGWHYDPRWTLSLVGTQVGMMGPALLLGVHGAWRAIRRRRESDTWAGELFLISCSAPILVFYLLVSLVAEPEGNWPMAGYITLLPLGARSVVQEMPLWEAKLRAWRALPRPRPREGFVVRRPETYVQVLWYATVILGVIVALGVPRLDLLAKTPLVGRYIPLHRFMGADRMAANVSRLLDDLRQETGLEPVVMAQHYGRASQMAFYLPGKPVVYCTTSLFADGRPTQYDYWAQTDLRRVRGLEGRPAVVIGATREDWLAGFDRVELVGTLDGDGKRNRPAFKAYAYHGFPALPVAR